MLTLSGITKSFGGRTLFADAGLSAVKGDRIGLVGPNGAGKSTLFRLILGEEKPDEGTVTLNRGVSVGYLPQESAPVGDETVLEIASTTSSELVAVRNRLRVLRSHSDSVGAGKSQGTGTGGDVIALPAGVAHDLHDNEAEWHALQRSFDELGGYQVEARAKRILAGLSFRQTDFERPARQMSGGWVMRAHLARLLVQEPDILMLDEPTNHLDLEALLWVQSYLQTYPGAILLISHDREFLNRLCTHIVEIRQGRVLRYTGNYDSYLAQREINEQAQLAAHKSQQREIARLQEFADRFRAKNTKASQAQSKLKQIERMEIIEAPESREARVGFRFPQPMRSGHRVIALDGVHYAYGELKVYEGLDFEAERGQRIVLVGPNGAGKSTLLKLLAGLLKPQAGECRLGHNVKSGYYAQHRVEMLHPELTVLAEALDTPQRVTEQFVRTVLGSFLFRGDDVFKPVSVLSGGEKSRLALVKLLLDPPNLLLMDEPTTHLDMPSIDALLQALKQFEGTLIFISHDVYFIRALANHVVHVRAGRLTPYSGDYQYYLDKTAQSDRAGLTSVGTVVLPAAPVREVVPNGEISRKDQKRLEAETRQARAGVRRKARKRVESLEAEIARLEARQTELVHELEQPETYATPGRAMEVNRELCDIQDRLPGLAAEWESAAAELQSLESERASDPRAD